MHVPASPYAVPNSFHGIKVIMVTLTLVTLMFSIFLPHMEVDRFTSPWIVMVFLWVRPDLDNLSPSQQTETWAKQV